MSEFQFVQLNHFAGGRIERCSYPHFCKQAGWKHFFIFNKWENLDSSLVISQPNICWFPGPLPRWAFRFLSLSIQYEIEAFNTIPCFRDGKFHQYLEICLTRWIIAYMSRTYPALLMMLLWRRPWSCTR